MGTVEIIGFDISNWVRAARIFCEEKGVDYTLTTNGMNEFADMKGETHLQLHPFGRIPAIRHGDVVLFETLAIGHYIDRMFDGPRLVPEDPLEAVRMEQWVSALLDYGSRSIMGRCVVQYVLPQFTGKPIDRATIDAAIPDIRAHLAVFDRALDGRTFLHGNRPRLDDMILMPMVDALVTVAPEGPELVAEAPNVAGLRAAFQGRPSYHATIPQMFRKAA
ncbi:MAG: glutathione S-transferase family protein [Methyloceanibacter sp.]|uniref:glutathione S-transferase family protein n=1 Tax=Methyloceanibacter sp. TaxID=1965321 RepID=UPI003D6C7A35